MNPTAIDWVWTKVILCTVHSPVVLLRKGRRPKWHLGAWLGESPREEEKQFQQKGLETTGYMHCCIFIHHKYIYISYRYKSWLDIPQKQRDRQVKSYWYNYVPLYNAHQYPIGLQDWGCVLPCNLHNGPPIPITTSTASSWAMSAMLTFRGSLLGYVGC